MSAMLESPRMRAQVHKLSVAAYHALGAAGVMPERTELLRGVVFDKMPKSSLHVWMVRALSRIITNQLPNELDLRVEQPLTLADSEPEPDLCVVPSRPDDYLKGHPLTAQLVIEVCVNTEERDRAKSQVYSEAAAPEYWIFYPETRRVTVFTNPRAEGYAEERTVMASEDLRSLAIPALILPMASMFPPE
ncbi:MAG: Uma2 family endonuclease [Verrucomicrobiales bacterium]